MTRDRNKLIENVTPKGRFLYNIGAHQSRFTVVGLVGLSLILVIFHYDSTLIAFLISFLYVANLKVPT